MIGSLLELCRFAIVVLAIVILAVESFNIYPLHAQWQKHCFTASAERAKAYAEARKNTNCPVKCKGCGCKGGPGYRNDHGKCVSYARLVEDCGPPPYSRCKAECEPVVIGCDRPNRTQVEKATKRVKARHGCGSRGGPGYRGPDGKCVTRKRLFTVCGNPPTSRCKAENVRSQDILQGQKTTQQ